jgi:initiation factor 1A
MVKNKKGGSGHKKMASKHVKENQNRNRKVRLAQKGEIYAKVTTMYGGMNCEVMCNDKVSRLMIIRKKFSGRRRRDNNIKPNVIVLVGQREYEIVSNKKKPKVDLLEVYNNDEVDELVMKKQLNDCIIPQDKLKESEDNNPFDITYDEDDETTNTMINEKISKTIKSNKEEKKEEKKETEFNWDDI